MKGLWEVADFVRGLRRQLRFGELSRAPLQLIRLELRGGAAECEWMARPQDSFDTGLRPSTGSRNQTLQALQDAIAVRQMLFRVLPEVQTAEFRVYRQSEKAPPELIITGTVTRQDEAPMTVESLVMRAKLCGLHFTLDDGVLEALKITDRSLEFAT